MGQDNGIQTSETDNINNNLLLESYKGPEFILNKNYPNKENMSLEEIIKSHLEEMNYSFKNKENENININSQIEPNSLTPKFILIPPKNSIQNFNNLINIIYLLYQRIITQQQKKLYSGIQV